MATDASATGLKSFIVVIFTFWGIGTMLDDLKMCGTVSCEREELKMSMYMSASWSARVLGTLCATPSGPAALRGVWFSED